LNCLSLIHTEFTLSFCSLDLEFLHRCFIEDIVLLLRLDMCHFCACFIVVFTIHVLFSSSTHSLH